MGFASFLPLALWTLALVLAPAGRTAEEFRLAPRYMEIAERGPVAAYTLITPSSRYAFMPPEGWKIRTDPEEKRVTITPLDLSVMISFKIHSEPVTQLIGETPEERRGKVLQNFPGGKISNEFTAYTSGGQGPAFDVEGFLRNKKPMAARVAYITVPGGTIEFSLHTSKEKFSSQVFAFGNLLTSFRLEKPPPEKSSK